MNYDQMSDFEINRAVAIASGNKIWAECYSQWVKLDSDNPLNTFDPCNDPSDAWPIIAGNLIGLTPSLSGDVWEADRHYSHRDKNPLRAAMIVYLMMQETDK